MDKEIIEKLEEVGLTEAEVKVYLALLKLGETKTGEIIKKMGLRSSTIYLSLNKLIQRGLVAYVTKNKIKYFRAVPPEKMIELVRETEREIKKIIPELNSLMKKEDKKETKVEIYEGYNGLRDLTLRRLKVLKRGDEVCMITGEKSYIFEKYKILWKKHELEREKIGFNTKLIIPIKDKKTEKSEFKHKGRYVRYLETTLPSTFIVWKNFVDISILEGKEGKDIMIHIENDNVAKTYKYYFNMLWKIAKK